jgi:hypothetical protein
VGHMLAAVVDAVSRLDGDVEQRIRGRGGRHDFTAWVEVGGAEGEGDRSVKKKKKKVEDSPGLIRFPAPSRKIRVTTGESSVGVGLGRDAHAYRPEGSDGEGSPHVLR